MDIPMRRKNRSVFAKVIIKMKAVSFFGPKTPKCSSLTVYNYFHSVLQAQTGFLYANVYSGVVVGHIENNKAIFAWFTSVKGHARVVAIDNVPSRANEPFTLAVWRQVIPVNR